MTPTSPSSTLTKPGGSIATMWFRALAIRSTRAGIFAVRSCTRCRADYSFCAIRVCKTTRWAAAVLPNERFEYSKPLAPARSYERQRLSSLCPSGGAKQHRRPNAASACGSADAESARQGFVCYLGETGCGAVCRIDDRRTCPAGLVFAAGGGSADAGNGRRREGIAAAADAGATQRHIFFCRLSILAALAKYRALRRAPRPSA